MELQRDFEQIIKTCPGCKAGIEWYQRMEGKLHHIDLYATYDADSYFPCLAENLVEKYITGYRKNNSAILTVEFDKLMVDTACLNESDED